MKPGHTGLLYVLEWAAPLAAAGLDLGKAAGNEEVTATRADEIGDLALVDDGAQRAFGIMAGGRGIGGDLGQLHIHLRERLLHVLHVLRQWPEQHAALVPQRARHADWLVLIGGTTDSQTKLLYR